MPGRHEDRIRYEGAMAPPVKVVEAVYPARRVEAEVRGSEGSVRFGAGEGGADDLRLPAYIEKITHRSPRNGVGYLMTGNPEATKQTMTVDVTLKGEHRYRLGLYFLDSGAQQRRMSVELFDLATRKLIAPVELVEDFTGGKYLVYEYDRSCRIRLDHVSGGDAVINGIYFDAPGAK
jgi:hypothetical protein